MSEIADTISEQIEKAGESRLNSYISMAVAISATLMALFNVKDNNIVQAMTQAQAHAVDSWAYYQAKGTKQNLAESTKELLELQLVQADKANPEVKKRIQDLISANTAKVAKYEADKVEIKKQAEGFQAEYDRLNMHDDQFDLAEALISIGLSIFGIAALTQRKKLFYFGLIFSSLGILFGVAGFLGLSIHSDWMAQVLG